MNLKLTNSTNENIYEKSFYPDDINDTQLFSLGEGSNELNDVKKISIVFEKSSDFFGRIIIYHLELLS